MLYVGQQTAERWNPGQPSGHIVVSVPSALDADGLPLLDLDQALIWFGTPELPERVDAARIAHERGLALAAGAQPLSSSEVQTARSRGGERLELLDRKGLEPIVSALVERYSPEEVEWIEDWK